ncbi:MAG: hypothetical protein CXR30_13200 [Geobacter sp.]|nr:MAG: hypothetical protein CXR30_13200 [Geobacter sp.]
MKPAVSIPHHTPVKEAAVIFQNDLSLLTIPVDGVSVCVGGQSAGVDLSAPCSPICMELYGKKEISLLMNTRAVTMASELDENKGGETFEGRGCQPVTRPYSADDCLSPLSLS